MGMQRLADVFKRSAHLGAQAISNAIVNAFNEFTGATEQSDDVIVFCGEERRPVEW